MLEKIVLGTAQFGMKYGVNSKAQISKKETFSILEYCLENKIDKLDTAPAYGNSEELIGEYSKLNNVSFKITSKIDTISKNILESINESLDRLNTNKIDVFLFHSLQSFKSNKSQFIDHRDLKKYSNSYGISLYTNEEVSEIINIDELRSIQIPFNLLDNLSLRGDLISLIKQKNKKLFFRSIFLQGLFFTPLEKIPSKFSRLKESIKKINRISKKYNVPILPIIISYVFSQKADGVLIGIDSKNHLKKIIQSVDIIENENLFKEIDLIKVENPLDLDPRFW